MSKQSQNEHLVALTCISEDAPFCETVHPKNPKTFLLAMIVCTISIDVVRHLKQLFRNKAYNSTWQFLSVSCLLQYLST